MKASKILMAFILATSINSAFATVELSEGADRAKNIIEKEEEDWHKGGFLWVNRTSVLYEKSILEREVATLKAKRKAKKARLKKIKNPLKKMRYALRLPLLIQHINELIKTCEEYIKKANIITK